MVTSGVATRKAIDLDFEDESESAVTVTVHNIKPPFLDGKTVFTKQLEPINPVRDPTSDMAVFSRKGSALVKEKREQAERAKAAAKLAALGGTSLGNIMGVKDDDAAAEGTFCQVLVFNVSCRVGHSHSFSFFVLLSCCRNGEQRKLRRKQKRAKRIIKATRSSRLI